MKNRRQFLKESAGLAAGACLGLTSLSFLEGCKAPKYVTFHTETDRLVVNKAVFEDAKIVLLNPEHLDAPIFLKQEEDGSYTALLMLCTHKACDVRPTGSILLCPCHGSEFSQSGNVLKGPADEPLISYETKTEGEKVFVMVNQN